MNVTPEMLDQSSGPTRIDRLEWLGRQPRQLEGSPMSWWSGHQPRSNAHRCCARRRVQVLGAAHQRSGFTTARSSASAPENGRASEASPHRLGWGSRHGVRLSGRPQSGRFASMSGVAQISATHNKELERTWSSQTDWGPRRSIQCYAGYKTGLLRDENGSALLHA